MWGKLDAAAAGYGNADIGSSVLCRLCAVPAAYRVARWKFSSSGLPWVAES
jgi:hypothetical protein